LKHHHADPLLCWHLLTPVQRIFEALDVFVKCGGAARY
jgi:hypothetical protein